MMLLLASLKEKGASKSLNLPAQIPRRVTMQRMPAAGGNKRRGWKSLRGVDAEGFQRVSGLA
jgi:hypothetical protein